MSSRIAQSISNIHEIELAAVNSDIIVPSIGRNFPRKMYLPLGRFYEHLSVALYGGVRQTNRYVTVNGKKVLVRPDIDDKGSMREVKGCVNTNELNLFDFQMLGYLRLLRERPGDSQTLEVYRHSLKRIKSFEGTDEELFDRLCSQTEYCIRIPMSLAFSLWRSGLSGGRRVVRRYEGHGNHSADGSFQSCTCVRQSTLTALLVEPEIILNHFGLNPENFSTSRSLSPRDLSFNGAIVDQFPIVEISKH